MSADVDGPEPLVLAQAAFDLVESDAAAAARAAERALTLARARGDAEAQVAALHALSFARHELGDPRAIRDVRAAIRIGQRHGLVQRTALARRRLALDLAGRGAVRHALRELDLAYAALDSHEQARTEVFRIGILWYAGNTAGSLDGTERALKRLRRAGDTFWEAQLLRNRGGLLTERGATDDAESDLIRARGLFAGAGARTAALSVDLQLARIALSRGDLPMCLARLDAIETAALPATELSELEWLRARALASGRLIKEAAESLARAQAGWLRARREDHEGRFEAIRLTLMAGDPAGALALARTAQRSFAAQERQLHAARAGGLAVTCAIAAGAVRPSALRSGRAAAAILQAGGWLAEARRIRLAVARAAIELGQVRTARRELDGCAPLRRAGPIGDRVEAWHVEALIALAEGEPAAAQRAARRGLRVLEEHRAALGAADLRATASSIGAELAALGLRIALADPRPGPALEWAEALRASSLRLTPVTPPRSPELRSALSEQRQLSAEIARAEQSGRPTRSLLARQMRAETQIRRLSRHTSGEVLPSRARPTQSQLASALGPRALAEYVESEGELVALTLVDGRLRRHALGSAQGITEPLEWLRFGLTRLANLRADAPQRDALTAGAEAAANALQQALLAPLDDAIGDRELVLVPTGELHWLPWAMLPALRRRPVSVAPSASIWWALRSAHRARRRTKVVLVAGPALRHATAEVRKVATIHPAANVLTGAAATVAATARALDGATLAHLACHGHVRSDSPLFSSLQLADGRLSAYELQQLRRAPELIVLSACDLAISETHPGDEPLGFAGALLDMGTRTIIASVVPVPDAAARRVMPAFHRELAAGASPAVALARAQARFSRRDSPLAGFACLGAG